MSSKLRHVIIILSGGVLFCFDRWLKWQTLHAWSTKNLITAWFGWYPFPNPGIAFGIPIPDWGQIILTIPVLIVLIYFLLKNIRGQNSQFLKTLAFTCIIFGALSYLIDRILYHFTVDYLLIYTSIINVADSMIVIGFILYFVSRSTDTRANSVKKLLME